MSFHRGQHWYALCDHYIGETGRRCEAFVLPTSCSDPCAPAAVLVARGEVFVSARDAGWEIVGDAVLCPAHRRADPVRPVSSGVVDVPLFDLVEVAS